MKEFDYVHGPNKKQICFFTTYKKNKIYYSTFCRGEVLLDMYRMEYKSIFIGVPDNEIFDNYIVQLQDLLNKFSRRFKIDKIKIINKKTNVEGHNVYEVKLNNFWLHSPFNISFFTFILRTLAMFHETNNTLRQTIYGFRDCVSDDLIDKNIVHSKINYDHNDYVDSFDFIVKFMNHGNEIFYKNKLDNFECFNIDDFIEDIGYAYIARGVCDDVNDSDTDALKYFHRRMNKEKICR